MEFLILNYAHPSCFLAVGFDTSHFCTCLSGLFHRHWESHNYPNASELILMVKSNCIMGICNEMLIYPTKQIRRKQNKTCVCTFCMGYSAVVLRWLFVDAPNHKNQHYQCDPKYQSSWGQHGAHMGSVGPRWAPCTLLSGIMAWCWIGIMPISTVNLFQVETISFIIMGGMTFSVKFPTSGDDPSVQTQTACYRCDNWAWNRQNYI